VNTRRTNVLAAAIIWVLVLLSVILTTSLLFPNISRLPRPALSTARARFDHPAFVSRYRISSGGHEGDPNCDEMRAGSVVPDLDLTADTS